MSSSVRKILGVSFLLGILGKLLLFVSQYSLITWLGLDEYGVYVYVFSILSIVAIFSQFGLRGYILKNVVPSVSDLNYAEADSIFRGVLAVNGCVAIIVCIVYEAGVFILAPIDEYVLYAISGIFIIVSPMAVNGFVFLQAFKRVMLYRFLSEVLIPLSIAFGVLMLYQFGYAGSALGALVLRILLLTVIAVAVLFVVYRYLVVNSRGKRCAPKNKKEIVRFSSHTVFSSSVTVMIKRADIIMLGLYSSYIGVAQYNIALMISQLGLFCLSTLIIVMAPNLSELTERGELKKLSHLSKAMSTTSGAFAFLFLVGVALFGEAALTMVLAVDENTVHVTLILLVGVLINASFGPVAYLLIFADRQSVNTKVSIVTGVINVCLNYLLIPEYGMYGAAISTTVSIAFRNIVLGYCVYKYLGFVTLSFDFSNIRALKKC